jgi:hypothetical protein
MYAPSALWVGVVSQGMTRSEEAAVSIKSFYNGEFDPGSG